MSAPSTVVVHHRSGIGDLIWHIPYFRAIAADSLGGRITVVARSSCRATEVLAGEDCVAEVIEFDRRPRGGRRGAHDGLAAQWRFAMQLRQRRFDRIVIFSSRFRYGLIALVAGIRQRIGFGFSAGERLFLNRAPYIRPHRGPGNWVFPEATAFAVAHGWVNAAQVPRMAVLPSVRERLAQFLSGLPERCVAFAIGASNPRRHWGDAAYAALAEQLIASGVGVILVGGPAEQARAAAIIAAQPAIAPPHIVAMTDGAIQPVAAALQLCELCVGNDTGALNMAAAVGRPAIGLFGVSPPLLHDPLLEAIRGDGMAAITVDAVFERLQMRMGLASAGLAVC